LSNHRFEIDTVPSNFASIVEWGKREGEGRVVIGKGAGKWGGQATIMMCGCDGGWNGGDGSLKSYL
jgi:hypothetical protein